MDCKLQPQNSSQGLRLQNSFVIEKMKKLLGSSGMKTLEQYRSLASGYNSVAPDVRMLSNFSHVTSESVSSFVYLMVAAEEFVKGKASVRKDLEMANSKLMKLMERIRLLEEKLEDASNKNAKVKVKQSGNEKLFEGIESNVCLTKTLCSQVSEALQQLNAQVQEDKAMDKLCGASLHLDMKSMSLRLYYPEKTIKICDKELMERIKYLMDEQEKASSFIEEKDGSIEDLKEAVAAADKMNLDGLASMMEGLNLGSRVKKDDLLKMNDTIGILRKENMDLISSKLCLGNKLEIALKEIKRLEDSFIMLIAKLTELDNQSLAFSEKIIQLIGSFGSCLELAWQEKGLAVQRAQQKIDQMRRQFLNITSERDSLQFHNHELHSKVLELQKEQIFVTVQHSDECRLAEVKVRKLESEVETLRSKQSDMQALITVLEDSARSSLQILRLSDQKMQGLMLKLSRMENESKGLALQLQAKEKLYEAQKKQIICIQQDHVQKEVSLIYKHKEEVKRLERHAKNELMKKSISLKSEHEAQLRVLRYELEDECRRLQEELDNQKAKVRHCECEIETSNGSRITKRKRTKCAVIFEESRDKSLEPALV